MVQQLIIKWLIVDNYYSGETRNDWDSQNKFRKTKQSGRTTVTASLLS